jgi:hypothetical protein
MYRIYRVSVEVTVEDEYPDDAEREFKVVADAIEEARQQLLRWEQGENVDPIVEELT